MTHYTVHLYLVAKDLSNPIDFIYHDIRIVFACAGFFVPATVLSNLSGTDLSEKGAQSVHEFTSH